MRQYLILAAIVLSTATAAAHEAPTGWAYPFACCSNQDCRMVPDQSVLETKGGYLASNGETIPYADTRIRPSPDGKYHLCTVAGKEDTRTICLFVPPRAF